MTALRRLRLVDSEKAGEAPAVPAVRVAITTQDMKSLNAHFGSARHFALYNVTLRGWSFFEAVTFEDVSDEGGQHKTDGDRITPKVEALRGCHLLFCLAIGGPSAAKVVTAKVHPIKIARAQPIEAVLERTRDMLAGSPPPWLRKVLAAAGAVAPKPSFVDDED
ncbi:nitrogen fixation protein NifX [Methylobacterium nodulans]|uniref:Nitrogen fixation protein NifX n=1 Tax=Methylobacterium nodulans (strain LMG 21967 / CNCM I-2342 / ORS 2060) TaxID=460265 RepID=B8ITG2_METNO|nr:nitrogen fixation protein NifX [Methylobacterium nodulans]ACL58878.1 nitrogen fixation protein NifX [Methylobacterium nodulans ORS 2060]